MSNKYLLWLHQLNKEDTDLFGEKAANLGEIIRLGITVPNGFAVSKEAFNNFINTNGLKDKIEDSLGKIDPQKHELLEDVSNLIKKYILNTPLNSDLSSSLLKFSKELIQSKNFTLIVRSSTPNLAKPKILSHPDRKEIEEALKGLVFLVFLVL